MIFPQNEEKVLIILRNNLIIYIFSYVFVVTLIFGPPTVLYLLYYVNIGFVSETPSRISLNLPPQQNYLDDTKNLQEKEITNVDNKSETKYILTWCEAYGGYKYGWEFGEGKFR